MGGVSVRRYDHSWWTVLAWMCCPGECHRLGSSSILATGHTPSMGYACLLSVRWNELESGRSTLDREVQWDFRVHGSSCGTHRDVLLRRYLRRQLHLLPVQVAGMSCSEKWELYLYGDMSIKVDRVSEEVLPRGVPPLRFFTLLGNGSHHLGLCLPFERGMGMSMPLAVPVLSGKFCGTCVSTAPALEHAVFSFS